MILEKRHHFLTTCTWDALNVNANRTKLSLTKTERCSNHEFLLEQPKNYLVDLTRKQLLGLMTEKVMRRNVWNDFANWHMKRLSNCTTSLLHSWTTIISKWKNWKQLGSCQEFDLKSSRNACTWLELEDLTFYGL